MFDVISRIIHCILYTYLNFSWDSAQKMCVLQHRMELIYVIYMRKLKIKYLTNLDDF